MHQRLFSSNCLQFLNVTFHSITGQKRDQICCYHLSFDFILNRCCLLHYHFLSQLSRALTWSFWNVQKDLAVRRGKLLCLCHDLLEISTLLRVQHHFKRSQTLSCSIIRWVFPSQRDIFKTHLIFLANLILCTLLSCKIFFISLFCFYAILCLKFNPVPPAITPNRGPTNRNL